MAITLSYTFSPNTTIRAAQVNSNFSTLASRALDKTGDTMTGNLLFTDGTYDIGASGATRPRDLYLSRNLTVGGTATLGSLGAALNLGSTGQIVFPSTQNASTNANTLDDYEEGTFTPTFSFATPGNLSISYAIQSGWYTKVGRQVTVAFVLVTSAFTHTTASGAAQLSITSISGGSSFTPLSTLGVFTGALWGAGFTDATHTNFIARMQNTNVIDFVGSASGVNAAQLTTAHFPSGGAVTLLSTITFFV